jgi:threonine/homoserine/homoserine lactone efflux protein
MIPAIDILLKGIILGLAVSMPPGPIGIVLINRTIKRGWFSGFFPDLALQVLIHYWLFFQDWDSQ